MYITYALCTMGSHTYTHTYREGPKVPHCIEEMCHYWDVAGGLGGGPCKGNLTNRPHDHSEKRRVELARENPKVTLQRTILQ